MGNLHRTILALVVASIVSLAGLALVVAQRGVLFPFAWTANSAKVYFGVTIDAGSHGTRAHLYSWEGRVEDERHPLDGPVTIPAELAVCDGGAALSSFTETPELVGPSALAPIIGCVEHELKKRKVLPLRWPEIPVFLKATAGMRNMDVDKRDMVMSATRTFLQSKTAFLFQRQWARVISGEEEGVFGWISVNNALGTLLSDANATTGALDLGGSSAQITFSPMHTSVLEDFFELNLGYKQIHLYSHSFLGYGWSDARVRMTTRLGVEALFNRLAASLNNHTALGGGGFTVRKFADRIIAGDVPGLAVTPAPPVAANTKITAPMKPAVAVFTANDPCVPIGSAYNFTLPDLLYPDGRFYQDLDLRAVLMLIDAMGISLDSPVISRNFPQPLIDSLVKMDQQTSSSVLMAPLYPEPLVDQLLADDAEIPDTTGRNGQPSFGRRLQPPSHLQAAALQLTRQQQIGIIEEEIVPYKPLNEPLPPPRVSFVIEFQGTSNFQECQIRAQELFYQQPCFLHTCSYNGVYQPRIADSRFLAFSQFTKVVQALGLPRNVSPYSLERESAQVCQQTLDALVNGTGAGKYAPFTAKTVHKLCWKAVWATSTLAKGYGFTGESKAISFAGVELTGDDADAGQPALAPGWALGAMVVEISNMPWQTSSGRYALPFGWALATTALLGLLSVALWLKNRMYQNRLSFMKRQYALLCNNDEAITDTSTGFNV